MADTSTESQDLSTPIKVIFGTYYMVVCLLGLLGNMFVLLTLLRYRFMRTPVNCHLANLALADLVLILLSILDFITILHEEYFLGTGLCKFHGYTSEVAFTVMSLTLASVALERYFAICRPYAKPRGTRNSVRVSFGIWALSMAFCSVIAYSYEITADDKGKLQCLSTNWSSTSKKVTYTLHTMIIYVLPLCVTLWAHAMISRALTLHRIPSAEPQKSQDSPQLDKETPPTAKPRIRNLNFLPATMGVRLVGRKRIIRMLFIVFVVFVILWTPVVIFRLLKYYGVSVDSNLWRGAQLLIFTSTATNGVIYVLTSRQFKRCFRDIIKWFTCRKTDKDLKLKRRSTSMSGIHRIRLSSSQLDQLCTTPMNSPSKSPRSATSMVF